MSKTVIKIENLSKVYRLGEIGTGTISHDLNRWWTMNVRGKEDPFAKLGNENDRTAKAQKGELVAALSNINLEVKQGEIVGIIGKNGAGKSTLLKLLSRVTSPTTGSIKTLGRMASLLEVGTGFHPEMTGRENIYMNGTIMGMRKWEIDKQFDAIVDFSGVEKYIDTPVKRYSSGMTVRLGFAIAAHLEPEILVVDEVLAVGDADFQKKAIGKMQDVSKNDGRTVLFVSHNMESILNLCNQGIILDKGISIFQGPIDDVVKKYISKAKDFIQKMDTSKPHITNLNLNRQLFNETRTFELEIEFSSPYTLELPNFGIVVKNKFQAPVFGTNSVMNSCDFIKSEFTSGAAKLTIKNLSLLPGEYSCDIYLETKNYELQFFENILEFETLNITNLKSVKIPTQKIIGSYAVDASWSYT